jgi:hypothetical protein
LYQKGLDIVKTMMSAGWGIKQLALYIVFDYAKLNCRLFFWNPTSWHYCICQSGCSIVKKFLFQENNSWNKLFFSWNKKTIFCCVSKAHLTVKHCPKRMHVSTNMIYWKSVQTCKFSRGRKGGGGFSKGIFVTRD